MTATHPLTPTETSLTQSSLGIELSSCGGRVEGKYSISKVTSSEVLVAAQYAPKDDRSSDALTRKSNGIGEPENGSLKLIFFFRSSFFFFFREW